MNFFTIRSCFQAIMCSVGPDQPSSPLHFLMLALQVSPRSPSQLLPFNRTKTESGVLWDKPNYAVRITVRQCVFPFLSHLPSLLRVSCILLSTADTFTDSWDIFDLFCGVPVFYSSRSIYPVWAFLGHPYIFWSAVGLWAGNRNETGYWSQDERQGRRLQGGV